MLLVDALHSLDLTTMNTSPPHSLLDTPPTKLALSITVVSPRIPANFIDDFNNSRATAPPCEKPPTTMDSEGIPFLCSSPIRPSMYLKPKWQQIDICEQNNPYDLYAPLHSDTYHRLSTPCQCHVTKTLAVNGILSCLALAIPVPSHRTLLCMPSLSSWLSTFSNDLMSNHPGISSPLLIVIGRYKKAHKMAVERQCRRQPIVTINSMTVQCHTFLYHRPKYDLWNFRLCSTD